MPAIKNILNKMTSTIARIKKAGKHFEIMVDMDKALAFKKNTPGVSVGNFLESDDIYTDLHISYVQATLGDKVEINTIDGKKTLTIPEGTQSHQQIRVPCF